MTEGVDHTTLSDGVYHKLRGAIVEGRMAPGQWLRQEALAQEYSLSQMPVREALRRLVADGLAERIPYRGVRVVEISPEDIADMFTLRLILEGMVVRYATAAISAEEIESLKKNLREAVRYQAPHEMEKRRALNTAFHLDLCRASGRRYLMHQIETLWNHLPSVLQYEGMRRQEALSQARLARESEEHWEVLRAVEARDADAAEAAVRRHVRNLAEELAQVLDIEDWGLGIGDLETRERQHKIESMSRAGNRPHMEEGQR